ncbi:hypothetical protein OSR40_022420 [Serratia rubidaea]|uniref:hypothetical protein n=1 Tax=Serratia rubidaea TaxID=61652 RepID=UPI0023AE8A83|nr:hypothetical protein [Serratia rubidaea]MDK1706494.1 hypothetical protein [Serratia rubidaea]
MKSEYKILWFEDQIDEVAGDYDRVRALVSEYGFVPEIIHRDSITAKEIDLLSSQLSSYNPYDLIIFDYDLGGRSEDGLSIAANLRKQIFTDMVFYSGQVPQQLRQKLFENAVDGVFIVHRNTFYDDIEPIIEDHIKKMSDINNIRGVVMSETSKMDLAIRDILIAWSVKADDESNSRALGKLKERLTKKLQERQSQIDKITSIEEIIGDYILTTFDNVRVSLKELTGDAGEEILRDGSLLHAIQVERNILAHCKCELTKEGKMVIKAKEPREYNFDEFKRLRKQILQAHKDIERLVG